MKTVEDLRNRAKELSKQAVELRRKGSEVYEENKEQAKHFRQQALFSYEALSSTDTRVETFTNSKLKTGNLDYK